MNETQVFNFENSEVRTVLVNDEPFFVGKDVTEILGYVDSSQAIKQHVYDEDKLTSNFYVSGQNRKMTIINESGIYNLIFGASKQGKNKRVREKAKKFKRWVTSEVLPSIRKHGMYATDELLDNPDLLIGVATKLKEEKEKRILAENTIQQLKPKADKYDKYIQARGTITVSIIAKNYGMCARKFNELLHDLGVQYKQKNTWLLYAKYQDKKYTHIEGFTYKDSDGIKNIKTTTKWTAKGHMFLYDLLRSHGYYPNIELVDEDDSYKTIERRA